jgi:hypothetical protein
MTDARPSYVANAQREVTQKAATIANRMARERLLGDDAPMALAARLAVMRRSNREVVRNSWSPFVSDSHHGLALKLRESDAMLMVDFGLLNLTDMEYDTLSDQYSDQPSILVNISHGKKVGKIIREIVTDAMQESIMANKSKFFRSMMKDLFENTDSYYEQFAE